LNAYVERFIQTIQQECLDRFVALGLRHLDYLCEQFVEYYHFERPHQGLNNERIIASPVEETDDVISLESIRCSTRLGGLLKSYSRMAA
jgi:putative transposase